MITRPELRQRALAILRGKWTQPVLAALIVTIVNGLFQGCGKSQSVMMITGGSVLALLVSGNFYYGFAVGLLRFRRGRESTVKEMFNAGFMEDYGRVLGIVLLRTLFILLWCLLLIIPGIIKAYSYAMASFIAEDDPELGPKECLERSNAMMDGHKMELFLLDLSFIGWILLGIITLGIGLLWVTPWIQMAHVRFYEELLGEGVSYIE